MQYIGEFFIPVKTDFSSALLILAYIKKGEIKMNPQPFVSIPGTLYALPNINTWRKWYYIIPDSKFKAFLEFLKQIPFVKILERKQRAEEPKNRKYTVMQVRAKDFKFNRDELNER